MTLAGFGVRVDGNEQLFIHTTPENFPLKKHNMVQAMLAVNDLFYLASPHVKSLFLEDVTQWLDQANIRYMPNVKFVGKTGYDYMFNFAIPKSREQPERLVQTLPNPQKGAVKNLMFNWIDTKETRPADAILFVFLNDGDMAVSSSDTDALKEYNAKPVQWSQREQVREQLAA